MQRIKYTLVRKHRPQLFFTKLDISKFLFSSTNDNVVERVDGILADHRSALSRTVTLIESARHEHRQLADTIMKELLIRTPERRNSALRIGIRGAPGAGKSTLIEKLGF